MCLQDRSCSSRPRAFARASQSQCCVPDRPPVISASVSTGRDIALLSDAFSGNVIIKPQTAIDIKTVGCKNLFCDLGYVAAYCLAL